MAPGEKRERDIGSGTPLAKKVGAKPGARAFLVNPPHPLPGVFGAEVQVLKRASAPLDAVVFFTTERRELERKLPALRDKLADDGMLWVAWPKKASKVPTDVTEDVVRDFAAGETDLVDVKVIAIDETWSGLKLVIRNAARNRGCPVWKRGAMGATLCHHRDMIQPCDANTRESCEECLKTGSRWGHLRLCLTCGKVG